MKTRLTIFLILLVAIGTFAFKSKGGENEDSSALKLYGNVEIRKVDLSFPVSGIIQTMTAEEGEHITKGTVLATLDNSPYHQALNLAEARKLKAEANLLKLQTGFRPEEIEQTEASVQQWKARIEVLEKELERRGAVVEDGGVTKQSVDQVKSKLEEMRAGLRASKAALALQKSGYRAEDVHAAKAGLEEAKAMVAQAAINMDYATLKAPSNGVLLTRLMEPGAVAGPGQPLYSLSLEPPTWIRAYIDEPNLNRIKPGMKVRIFSDGAPDKAVTGHIGYISPEAEFTPKSVQTEELRTGLVYRVRIIVEEDNTGLRQGMPVTIHLDQKED